MLLRLRATSGRCYHERTRRSGAHSRLGLSRSWCDWVIRRTGACAHFMWRACLGRARARACSRSPRGSHRLTTISCTISSPSAPGMMGRSKPNGFVRSRHCRWPTRARVGRGPPLTKGAAADAVLGMRVGSCDRAAGAHCPGLPPVPLPPVRQAVHWVLSALAPAIIACALGRAATSRRAACKMASTVAVLRR